MKIKGNIKNEINKIKTKGKKENPLKEIQRNEKKGRRTFFTLPFF